MQQNQQSSKSGIEETKEQKRLENENLQLQPHVKMKEEQIVLLKEWQKHLDNDILEMKDALQGKENFIEKQNEYIKKLEQNNQELKRQVDRVKINQEKIVEKEKELDELETIKAKYALLINEINKHKIHHIIKILFIKEQETR